jgi:hypothetical protein
MLCIHTDISNKPDLIVNDLSTSTSHTFDSELDSVDIKPVIVDAACLDISCSNNCVKPNSNDSGTQGKFDPISHHCGKVGHIRPKCYLLKSHRPWKKQEDSKRGFIDKTSSDISLDFLLVALRIFCRYILGMTEKACHCFSVLV